MATQIIKAANYNLGLFLVFGLLTGMLFNNLAFGVLGGLLCHLVVSGFNGKNDNEEADEQLNV